MALDWLIVGLGNPGPQYAATRHNAGFLVVDALAERWSVSLGSDHRGRFGSANVEGRKLALLMPMTFMNLSGESVRSALSFYKLPVERLVVVHDEIDIPFGEVRVKEGGGLAGHNGLKSLAAHLGTQDFRRVRLGVGRPAVEHSGAVTNWVLGRFSPDDDVQSMVDDAVRTVEELIAS